jgi:ribosomal protein RSM22 (predicted rRNA methylase)
MSRYPGALDTAVEAEIAARTPASLRPGSAALTAQYRKGGGSDGQDLASYLAVRLPATFAVCQHIFAEIARRIPDFAPATLADVGAGPGTASWVCGAFAME